MTTEELTRLQDLIQEVSPLPWKLTDHPTLGERKILWNAQKSSSVARIFLDIDAEYVALVANLVPGMLDAVVKHHSQKADDRCWESDNELYAAFGLPPADYHVGNKDEMLENCRRFIEVRCQSGTWKSYAELEHENTRLKEEIRALKEENHSLEEENERFQR